MTDMKIQNGNSTTQFLVSNVGADLLYAKDNLSRFPRVPRGQACVRTSFHESARQEREREWP